MTSYLSFLLLSLYLIIAGYLPSMVAGQSTATITIDTSKVVHFVDAEYISFNFDWHLNTEEEPAWFNSSVLAINLTDPRLIYLTSQLQPAHLRIGGSEGDNVTYEIGTVPCPQNRSFCLTMDKWNDINQFALTTNVTIAFGLNAMQGRSSNGRFNSLNAQQFLQYTATMPEITRSLYAFEFGNELEYKTNVTAYALDALLIKSYILNYWSAVPVDQQPKLIANDENPDPSYWSSLIPLVNHSVDILTWHLYVGYGLDPQLPSKAWERTFLNGIATQASPMLTVADTFLQQGGKIAVGETALAWHSGRNGTTNTFSSGPWYISQLGQLASTHSFQCRQTLLGGYYELIDKFSMLPNPDYWTALLWKMTMGTGVLTTSTDSSDIDAFTHCTASNDRLSNNQTGLTIAWVNLSPSTTYTINVPGIDSSNWVPREEYILTSPDNNLASQTILLNNNPLTFSNGQLSPLIPVTVMDPSVAWTVPPLSYGYTVFPNAPNPCT